jgi:cyclophilin family peptidyl-prolyl cis-trans isomerase
LAAGGYFDGLTFHRIVPEFVIQSGDPRGDGTGGPGYRIDAEFNERAHEPGTLSMAREEDPIERQGAAPRPEYADSGGSQFFISLKRNRQLDRRFTVFGKVTDGMDAVRAIAATPVGGEQGDAPQDRVTIKSVTVRPATADANPYANLLTAQDDAGEAPALPTGPTPAPGERPATAPPPGSPPGR